MDKEYSGVSNSSQHSAEPGEEERPQAGESSGTSKGQDHQPEWPILVFNGK